MATWVRAAKKRVALSSRFGVWSAGARPQLSNPRTTFVALRIGNTVRLLSKLLRFELSRRTKAAALPQHSKCPLSTHGRAYFLGTANVSPIVKKKRFFS